MHQPIQLSQIQFYFNYVTKWLRWNMLIYCLKSNSLNAHRADVVCIRSCGVPQPEVLYFPLFKHEIQTVE